MSSVQLSVRNPGKDEFETMRQMCIQALLSGFLPDDYKVGSNDVRLGKAITIALKGRELGVPMMQAFSHIHIIKGKPAISSELMLALVKRMYPKLKIKFPRETWNENGCVMRLKEPDDEWEEFAFTAEDAKRARLIPAKPDSTWTKYPKEMYKARVISSTLRARFPEALMGCSYTPEELGKEVVEVEIEKPPALTPPPAPKPAPKKQEPKPTVDMAKKLRSEKEGLAKTYFRALEIHKKEEKVKWLEDRLKKHPAKFTLKEWDKALDLLEIAVKRKLNGEEVKNNDGA